MARKQKYKVDEVLRHLSKKNDVLVENRKILILKDEIFDVKQGIKIPNPKKKFDLGNGSWGKIDFLVNHNGYTLCNVDNLHQDKKNSFVHA
jgi:hypothetical protein